MLLMHKRVCMPEFGTACLYVWTSRSHILRSACIRQLLLQIWYSPAAGFAQV